MAVECLNFSEFTGRDLLITALTSTGSTVAQDKAPELHVLSRSEHGISRQAISPNSLKVLYTLIDAGHEAYIVGGGVRDLLLGQKPKDFDIATDATPEQIRHIFRNSRIIGRRFRIVHVHFGREIIEVSTFRGVSGDNLTQVEESLTREASQLAAVQASSGMLLRDNVYGTIEQDVMRRDFTVNALYYTVKNFVVHDYVNGMADIDRRCLRMIGDPEQRYREDPVRVLRAIRLAAKLDFSITPETAEPLPRCARLLESVPSARLFDEFMKLFLSGYSLTTYRLLRQYGVFEILFPGTAAAMRSDTERYQRLMESVFADSDARIEEGKSVTPVFLLAVLLWPALQRELQRATGKTDVSAIAPLQAAAQQVVDEQVERIAIPKRFSFPVREIWELQHRFHDRRGRRAELLLTNKRFRAAFDFLLLREASGEDVQGLGQWWTEYQDASPERQAEMQAALAARPSGSRSKPRRRKPKARAPE